MGLAVWLRRVASICIAVSLSGCGSFIPFRSSLFEPAHLFPEPTDKLTVGTYSVPTTLEQFVSAAQTANVTSAKPADFKIYVSKGINLSNDQCNAWLDALSHQNTEVELGTGLFNITDNTLVAAMGLAEVSAAAISGVGLGAAAVNAGAQQYRASILFTLDFATLHQKIGAARKSAQQLMLATTYSNFDDATRDLVEFDRMCSRDSIQLLLQQSLASSQYQIPTLALPPVAVVAPGGVPAGGAPAGGAAAGGAAAGGAPAGGAAAGGAAAGGAPAGGAATGGAPAAGGAAGGGAASGPTTATPPAAPIALPQDTSATGEVRNSTGADLTPTPPSLLLQNQPAAQVVIPTSR